MKDAFQLSTAISGQAVLVTGRRPGHDVDGGSTTVRSPCFAVPAHGRGWVKLRHWVGMSVKARANDGLAIRLVDADGKRVKVLHKVSGTGKRQRPAWRAIDKRIPPAFAGQRLAIEIEAVDAGGNAMVEAGIDQVRATSGWERLGRLRLAGGGRLVSGGGRQVIGVLSLTRVESTGERSEVGRMSAREGRSAPEAAEFGCPPVDWPPAWEQDAARRGKT